MKFMQIKLKLQQAEPTLQHMAIRLTPKQRSNDPRILDNFLWVTAT